MEKAENPPMSELARWLEQAGEGSIVQCQPLSGGDVCRTEKIRTSRGTVFCVKHQPTAPERFFAAEAEGLAPLLRRVRFETGCSILIIEHDMPLISAVSDELIALDQGQFVTRGRPAEVLEDERVVESYLGTTEEAVNRSGSFT
jgi:ABC-type lipopolysaccharide export system ATPase subunit